MPTAQDRLKRAFWSVDRVLGGQQSPTRSQRFAARHPLGLGVCIGAPIAILCTAAALGDHASPGEALIPGGLGAALGVVFGLTAWGERHRQRRLRRLGLWTPPTGDRRGEGSAVAEPTAVDGRAPGRTSDR
ncbi:hypothetical protein [Streptomyces sp. NPDC002580]|uniref:hypothetical protein n=1 Tax=Streptomyces sp. NPDC002580 TaxID=3364653 RepID=UPI0036A571B7